MRGAALDVRYLERQRDWSISTFGPGDRTEGVLDHILKELEEIKARPDDVEEWADLLILAFDGAMRSGHTPQHIIDAVRCKHRINESRIWPDWRTQPTDKAIEHIRA